MKYNNKKVGEKTHTIFLKQFSSRSFCIGAVNPLEQQVAVTFPFLVLSVELRLSGAKLELMFCEGSFTRHV